MRKKYLFGLLMVVMLATSPVATAAGNPKVAPPSNGANYSQLGDQWFIWFFDALDNGYNPSGNDCYLDKQPTDKIFLMSTGVGNSVERTCNIPAGKQLFFPVLTQANGEVTNFYKQILAADPNTWYNPFIWEFWNKRFMNPDNVVIWTEVDGVRVKSYWADTKLHRTKDGLDGAFLLQSKTLFPPYTDFVIIQGGYYVLLNPLSPGEHTITFYSNILHDYILQFPAGATGCPAPGSCPERFYAGGPTVVTYRLKVG